MTLTLLIDLDNTLLENDLDVFIPAYLRSLSDHLSSEIDTDCLINSLWKSTRVMINNNLPTRTLKETFDQVFYPAIGISETSIREKIEEFYTRVFPSLKNNTHQRPEAIQLVNEAAIRGYQIILATNPIFPRKAILHRLDWAGFPNFAGIFAYIPSYESFHFAKPNPSYYGELLAAVGCNDQPVVMVGDDLENDIYAAREAGIKSYWVNYDNDKIGLDVSDSGTLSGVIPWLDKKGLDAYSLDISTPSAILAVTCSTPAALSTISMSITPDQWTQSNQTGEWSQTEILCHLRDVEIEVNLPRVKKTLEESNPFIPGLDTDRWAVERTYASQNGSTALNDFIQARQVLINILEDLSPEHWQRSVRHAILGPTTLLEIVKIIAGHDRIHIHQIFQNQSVI